MINARRRAICLLAGAALVTGALTGCDPSSDPTPSRSPSLTASTVPSTPTPASITTAPPDSRKLVAALAVNVPALSGDEDFLRVTRYRTTTVVVGIHGVAAFDGTGKQIWTLSQPTDAPTTFDASVAGNTTVVTWTPAGAVPSPGRITLHAVDTVTGRSLWSDTRSAFATTVIGTVYTSTCKGSQTGALGACTVHARDVRTGSTRWSAPSYSDAQVEISQPLGSSVIVAPPMPDVVLVRADPVSNSNRRYYSLDPDTGAALASLPKAIDEDPLQIREAVAQDGAIDQDPTDGCSQSITAVNSRTGAMLWHHTWSVDSEQLGSHKGCAVLGGEQIGNLLAVQRKGGHLALLDPVTGRSAASGSPVGYLAAATTSTLLLRAKSYVSGPLSAVSRPAGKTLWSANPLSEYDVTTVGAHVLVGNDECASHSAAGLVLRLTNGARQSLFSGCVVGNGTDWFATEAARTVRIYPLS